VCSISIEAEPDAEAVAEAEEAALDDPETIKTGDVEVDADTK